MGTGNSLETTPQLDVYDLETPDPNATLSMLQSLLPDAQLTLDPTSRRLVAMAIPADQQAIRATLERLQGKATGGHHRELRVHGLTRVAPPDVVTALKDLAPRAQVTLQADGRGLMVVAAPEDQEKIAAALAKVEQTAAEHKLRFEMYSLEGADPAQALPALKSLIPGATLTIDPKTSRLIAWASDEDHTAIAQALEKLQSDASPETTRQLEVYRLTTSNPATTQTLLAGIVPNARLTYDSQSGSLIALATPNDQKTIRATLEQLQSDEQGPDAPELRFYPLSQTPPPTLITGLQRLAKKAQITVEAGGKRLMVVASPKDHATIQATLDKLERDVPLEESRFEVYPVHAADATSLLATLKTLVPTARLSIDAKTGNLIAWATDEDHGRLAAAVGKLGEGDAGQFEPRLQVYRLTSADPNSVVTVLKTLFPKLRIVLDPQDKTAGRVGLARAAGRGSRRDRPVGRGRAGRRVGEGHSLFGQEGVASGGDGHPEHPGPRRPNHSRRGRRHADRPRAGVRSQDHRQDARRPEHRPRRETCAPCRGVSLGRRRSDRRGADARAARADLPTRL